MFNRSETKTKIFNLHGPKDLRIEEQILDLFNLNPNEVSAKTLVTAISPGTELGLIQAFPT